MRATKIVVSLSIVSACGGGSAPSDAAIDVSSDAAWPANQLVCAALTDPVGGVRRIAACSDYEGPSSPAVCGYGDRVVACPDGAAARCDYTPSADGTTLVMFMYPPIDLDAARMLCPTGTFTAL